MARDFYKQGGSYFYSDNNQKILDIPSLQAAAKAGGKEISAPASALPTGMTQITSPEMAKSYNIAGQVGATGTAGSYLYGTPKPIAADSINTGSIINVGSSKPDGTQADATAIGAGQSASDAKIAADNQAIADAKAKTPEQTNADALTARISELLGQDVGKAQATVDAEVTAGVPGFNTELAQVNSDITTGLAEYNQLKQGYEAASQQLEGQGRGIPIGLVRGQQAQLQYQQQNTLNTKAADIALLQARALGLQGKITAAQDAAKKAVDLKYSAIEEELAVKTAQLALLQPTLDKQDKERAAELTRLYEQQKIDIAEIKNNEKSIQSLALRLAENKAPTKVIEELSRLDVSEPDYFNKAVALASPYLQSLADKLDIDYKLAQTAKVYNDIKTDNIRTALAQQTENRLGSEGTMANVDPMQMLAYAQEYAATGKIPTGIPKNSFGIISQYAKELPKQAGEIVATPTGVKPSSNTAYADALSSMYSATQLAKQLKEIDKKRISGVVGGTLGKVFGSKTQQEYIDLRAQIVDLLSRARSGAAINETELRNYNKMLPGRFNEPFGVGADSSVRINNFINALESDAKNKASSQGWAVYGLSKVTINGTEYKVGDIIKNASGQMGRINADGSITLSE